MIARFFRSYCLCVVIIIVIFLEVALGLNIALNFNQSMWNELTNVDRQNVFNPNFMDPGNFNAEKAYSGSNTCIADSIDCNPSSVYRTYDGTCNNLAHPTWGKAEGCHTRILEAHYEGAYNLRRSVKGGPLPLPRKMVLQEFGNRYRPTHKVSLFFTIFGQLVAHEMTHVDMQLDPDPRDKNCCQIEELAKNTSLCIPFIYPPDDPFYSKFNLTCFDLRRSVPCPRCISDKKQSLNYVTATIDGSLFYGNSEKRALELRALDGTGRMNVTKTEFGELLPTPPESDLSLQFCPAQDRLLCFEAGDARVNQHSPLMSVSTLFVREHNKLADRLGKLNPGWDDETRFQEARRIVAAELQNIVYSEYLPALLSAAHMSHYNLSIQTDVRGTQYYPSVNLGIWNEFATSIFRLHSMIATQVGFDHHQFKDYFANALMLREGKMDNIIQGTCKVPSQKNDHWFIKDVTNHLYQESFRPLPFGEDLVSLDLLRGRDNGIAPYVDMLRHLSSGRIDVKTFYDLASLMSWTNIQSLKNLYKDVCDVDLFAGALMETNIPGSHLGPTAAAIVSMQFNNIKFGDRFYFEHEGEAGSFSPDQRESLKKVTLARILCDNLKIKNIQKNPLFLESQKNPMVKCEDIPPSLDLSSWTISSN